jgi:hypothetical protein
METITLKTNNKLCKNTLVIFSRQSDKNPSLVNFKESPVNISIETDGKIFTEINTMTYYKNTRTRKTNELMIPIPRMTSNIIVAIQSELSNFTELASIRLKLSSKGVIYNAAAVG